MKKSIWIRFSLAVLKRAHASTRATPTLRVVRRDGLNMLEMVPRS